MSSFSAALAVKNSSSLRRRQSAVESHSLRVVRAAVREAKSAVRDRDILKRKRKNEIHVGAGSSIVTAEGSFDSTFTTIGAVRASFAAAISKM